MRSILQGLSWILVSALAVCLLAADRSCAGEAGFSAKPTVSRDGDKVKISFTISAPTDVEVAVLAADGKVVRHLVAGMLGGKDAPPEPLKAGLVQSIEWDGKDNAGKPAAGGPFKVRVRAGMTPQLDGFLLDNPASTGSIHSVAIGPKGAVYLFHIDAGGGHWGSTAIKVLTRDGNYRQTVKPFPADVAPEKVKALGVFVTEQGDLVPRVHHLLRRSFYPITSIHDTTAQCPAVDSRGRVYWMVIGPALAALDADGGVPYESLVGPRLLPDLKGLTLANTYLLGCSRPCLALSSDERSLYFAGLTLDNPKHQAPFQNVPCVFRVDLKTRGPAEVFLGKLDAPGAEKDRLTGPRGLALAKGLLYVADHAADRVAVFNEADRSLAGEIKVKAPDSLGVDPTDGAVYVCSLANPKAPELIKFENHKTGKELYRLNLPGYGHATAESAPQRIAVDASAKPVRIWLPQIPYSRYPLLCIEDAGDKFVLKGDFRSQESCAQGPRDMSVDRVRDELYVKSHTQMWYRFDEKTGKVMNEVRLPGLGSASDGTQLVVDADGNLNTYSWSNAQGLRRFTRDGKPLNWPGQKSNHIPISGTMCYQMRYLALLRPDELFVIPPRIWRTATGGGSPTSNNTTCVNVMNPDGTVKRTVIWQCFRGAIIHLDSKGNIYLADMVKPPGRATPEFFDGKLPPPPTKFDDEVGDASFYTSFMYGSIVKFPPEGGAIWYRKDLPESVEGQPPAELLAKPKVPFMAHNGRRTAQPGEIQGALWSRFGFAPYTAVSSGCSLTCACESGGFDVDAYGRVFFPNLGQFRVEVIDTNGNPITVFGKYGNQDSGGKDARLKTPDIPLCWPLTVAVSDTHAYVADTLSRRVAKVKLGWAAEDTRDVK